MSEGCESCGVYGVIDLCVHTTIVSRHLATTQIALWAGGYKQKEDT